MTPREAAKAIVAALIAGLSALVPVAGDGLSVVEALTAVVAALVAGSAVFYTENADAPTTEESSSSL